MSNQSNADGKRDDSPYMIKKAGHDTMAEMYGFPKAAATAVAMRPFVKAETSIGPFILPLFISWNFGASLMCIHNPITNKIVMQPINNCAPSCQMTLNGGTTIPLLLSRINYHLVSIDSQSAWWVLLKATFNDHSHSKERTNPFSKQNVSTTWFLSLQQCSDPFSSEEFDL